MQPEALLATLQAWMGAVASALPVGYALAAGMVSAVNPCGFAMLPAYLALYLGTADLAPVPAGAGSTGVRAVPLVRLLLRAIAVSLGVTGGFLVLFSSVGVVFAVGGQLLMRYVPWVAVLVGAALVVLGGLLLAGRHVGSALPARLSARVGNPGRVSLRGFFLFGIAYGLASLSCTLPVFLTVVGTVLLRRGIGAGVLQFVNYALGMGVVILLLTVGLAFFKGITLSAVRSALPWMERGSGVLLVLAGVFIIYYWVAAGLLSF